MVARNNITGDKIQSKINSAAYEDNYDQIFRKQKPIGSLDESTPPPAESVEYSEDWQSSKRDKAIAQNGNVGYTQEQIDGDQK